MSNKKGKRGNPDAFAGLSVDGMDDRYDDKNSAEVKRKRASELDRSITALDSEKKDLAWAEKVEELYAEVKNDNRDVVHLCREVGRLERMLKESQKIRKDEEARLQAQQDAKRQRDEKLAAQKGGKDAFGGMSFMEAGDKYNTRNAEAHKLKRAAELDERIRAFANRKKDAAWIDEADDFVARETAANKDIFNLSKEVHRFPAILEEAKTLKALNDKAAKEKEEARLAQIEADKLAKLAQIEADAAAKALADQKANDAKIANAKAGAEQAKFIREKEAQDHKLKVEREQRENDDKLRAIQAQAEREALRKKLADEAAAQDKIRQAAAAKAKIEEQAKQGDELVNMLATSPRSKFWCDEVDKAWEEISSFPREARILMRRIPQLEELFEESKSLREAIVFDKRIEKLADVPQNKRNAGWAEDVINCEADLVSIDERLLKQMGTLKKLIPIAKRAKYDASIKTYEKLIRDMGSYAEAKVPEDVCQKYDKLNDGLKDLEYDPADYIQDFRKRWLQRGADVAASRDARDERARQEKIEEKNKREAEEARRRKEAAEKRAREEEMEREKIAEEYRIILVTVESGSFDDKLDEFDALYKSRSSVGFSLAQRIDDFENRMVAAKKAVSERRKNIKIADDLQKAAARQAAEEARKKAEAEARRREMLEAIRRNIALIISLSIVVLGTAGLVIAGILIPDLTNILIPAAVFLFVGYFVSGLNPIVRQEIWPFPVTVVLKSVCAVGGLVLTFLGLLEYGTALFGVILIGSAVEYLLLSISDYYAPSGIDAEALSHSSIISAAVGAALIFLNMGVGNNDGILAVIGIGAILVLVNVYFMFITRGEGYAHWIFIIISFAVAVAGLVMTFISRDCVQMAIFMGIAAALNFLVTAIGTQFADDDESQYATSWMLLAVTVIITLSSTLMYFKFWGKDDFVVSEDGTLLGAFVHDGKDALYIPEEWKGVTITTIGYDSLDRISLKWRCNFKKIVLPETIVEIEPHAFSYCNIPTVVLNEGLKKIGSNAFYEAYTTTLGYPEGMEVTEDMPDNYIPSTVEEIGADAFAFADIKGSLVTPENCKTIGGAAFHFTNLTDIDISSATNVGPQPFGYSSVRRVRVNENLTELPRGLYAYCEDLIDFNIPQGITELPDDCFRACESITEIIIPEGVTRIGAHAFGGCNNLRKMELWNVEYVGTNCFKNVGQPFHVYFGKGFKVLGKDAFWGSTGQLKIHYAGSQDEWDTNVVKDGNRNLGIIDSNCTVADN